MNDGPEIILKSIFQVCSIDDYDICCDYKIINSSKNFSYKLKVPCIHIHRELIFLFKNYKKLTKYKKIVVFTYYSSPLLLFILKILKLFKVEITIIGYDSFYRENRVKMQKQVKKHKQLPYYLKSLFLKFVEYLGSVASENIYLVSKKCIQFSKDRINPKGMYKHFPIIPRINNNLLSINKSFKTNQILIVGPFITDIDVIDLRINMKLISELNFIERVDFFGKDSEKVKHLSNSPGSVYSYVEDFDHFFSKNDRIVLFNRINTPGIQTRLQKIIMYNNLVYRHKDIDVGDYLNALSRNITDLKNIKENNNQVKLEDIENAFNNTLSDFKLITKDF